ncbi:MAG: protein-L-isoaspartate(D-aspartate) O-methyltransferase [Myxococcota bacterium]
MRGAGWVVIVVAGCGRAEDPGPESRPDATPTIDETHSEVMTSSSRPDAAAPLRKQLVRAIETFEGPWGAARWSPTVLAAMHTVPRHRFVPDDVSLATAYRDQPLPIGYGQTISQPTVVALMTQALALEGTEQVLEVGTGSGYQAAVLSEVLPGGHLHTIERIGPLAVRARRALAGRPNVTVHHGDGFAGHPRAAPYDRILLTAAPPQVPPALVTQLREGGILVGPIGVAPNQRLRRYRKRGPQLVAEDLGEVRFVPMVQGQR